MSNSDTINNLKADMANIGGKVVIEIGRSGTLQRQLCTACGFYTERSEVSAEGKDEHGKILICENCIKSGAVDERLRERIARRREETAMLEKLIGRMEVPTHAEWQEAEAAITREWGSRLRENERRLPPPDDDSEIPF